MFTQTYINATQARQNFFDLLHQIKKAPRQINITVKGVPEAVLMSKTDFDAWVATFETLQNSELMQQLGTEQPKTDQHYTNWETVKKELQPAEDVSSKNRQPGPEKSKKN